MARGRGGGRRCEEWAAGGGPTTHWKQSNFFMPHDTEVALANFHGKYLWPTKERNADEQQVIRWN